MSFDIVYTKHLEVYALCVSHKINNHLVLHLLLFGTFLKQIYKPQHSKYYNQLYKVFIVVFLVPLTIVVSHKIFMSWMFNFIQLFCPCMKEMYHNELLSLKVLNLGLTRCTAVFVYWYLYGDALEWVVLKKVKVSFFVFRKINIRHTHTHIYDIMYDMRIIHFVGITNVYSFICEHEIRHAGQISYLHIEIHNLRNT